MNENKRYKIKILNISGHKRWVRLSVGNGQIRIRLRTEKIASKLPQELLSIQELLDFLQNKEYEIIELSERYSKNASI